ncbi:conserved hypothetical protein [Uncinocarpus reesii 1704]|uniref:UmuC domain-containing protein n=1 Tax=Uncinocarpus reesii (strain UAMH 1704) TaxID=336963 RepID=C4JRK3_UNCRE|nr:uncharacterized protein UREG_05092 [Uncinocarpus reesii 1704]EEP80250.1 conserved hypothetical protein [Uncinocarpus reesii 1704]
MNAELTSLMGGSQSMSTWDYDCFYASVFEAENPALKSLPLAVQQKQIVVTCNYEARRRGLRKLQLIKEAKRICPDVVIMLGEDLTKFRDASKELHAFLKKNTWGNRVEKLGFDELLNRHDLQNSFFQLDKFDPTVGFAFDASTFCGPTYPAEPCPSVKEDGEQLWFSSLDVGLRLGSHLANYLRHQLEQHTPYTATVGISTSKLLAKLVGNLNKPRLQTTLRPPYSATDDGQGGNVASFLGQHEIGKIPGIGFKMAHRIRTHILGREPNLDVYEGLAEEDNVSVDVVRSFPGMGPVKLDEIFRGGGWPKDIGTKVWGLLNGVDDTEVAVGKAFPSQISIEDSYSQVDNLQSVRNELLPLTRKLLRRMHADLTEDEEGEELTTGHATVQAGRHLPVKRKKRWLGCPRTLRLSTRSRPPSLPDVGHQLHSNRISKSCPMPRFVFSFSETVEALAERLVEDTIVPLFRRLHPDKSGYKLSLINIAATNMMECAGSENSGVGQDIGAMFRNQGPRPTQFSNLPAVCSHRVTESHFDNQHHGLKHVVDGEVDQTRGDAAVLEWTSDEDGESENSATPHDECTICGAFIPWFAVQAHSIYHSVQT